MSSSTNFTGKIIDYFSNAPLAAVNAVFGIVRPIVQARNKAAEKAAAPVKSKSKVVKRRGRQPKAFAETAPATETAPQVIDGAVKSIDHAPNA